MGTIQRLPAVIKLARVFFGFSIISSRRSSLSVAPAPAGSRTLARADSSRLTIRMKPRLMWWQEGSPPHLAFHLCWFLLSIPSLLSCLQGCTLKTLLSSGERAPPPRSAVVTWRQKTELLSATENKYMPHIQGRWHMVQLVIIWYSKLTAATASKFCHNFPIASLHLLVLRYPAASEQMPVLDNVYHSKLTSPTTNWFLPQLVS